MSIERRRYSRERLHLPLNIELEGKQKESVRGWTLDASPAGILLEVPDISFFSQGETVNITIDLGDTNKITIGTGVVCHTAERDGTNVVGINLLEENPILRWPNMLGAHHQVLEIKSLLSQIVTSGLNVLIRGETGTGKNVLAKIIHDVSKGPDQPFVRVNCPSIPESLFEAELFGHEKGAYTDAKTSAPGYFRLASAGTVLLDEISEIRPALQAKLLRVIEDKVFMPVGGSKLVPVKASIIATSNVDLEKAVEQGSFRRDLYYRLCEMPLVLPSLRQRRGDISLLAHHFLLFYCKQFHRPVFTLKPNEIKAMEDHAWPGNIRELENCMKQTVLLGKFVNPTVNETQELPKHNNLIEQIDIPQNLLEQNTSLTELTKKLTVQIENSLIYNALQMCGQNKTLAADRLGISYRTLLRKLEQRQILE